MEGYTVLMALVAAAVIFIMKNNSKKQQLVQPEPEQLQPETSPDAIVKVGDHEVPVSFRGVDLVFTQVPDRNDYYNLTEDLLKVACDNSQETGHGLSIVVIQEVPGEYVVHTYFMARHSFGHLEEFVTIHEEFPETLKRVQKAIDAVLPIRK